MANSRYRTTVEDDEEYDSDLEPLVLKGRNPRMPRIYLAKAHPLHPRTNPGNSYVYYTRPTRPRMQELVQAGATILKGEGEEDERELSTDGMLELLPGDYLWTRNEFGRRKPEDDVPVAWVVSAEKRSEQAKTALDNARGRFMGPEDKITEKSVRFERLKPTPKPVKKGTRCWTMGSSLELNTNIEAPCANGKWMGQTTKIHETTQDVISASMSMAMEDMAHAPAEVQDVLKADFERHGMAPLGCKDNYAYHTVHCNLAYAGISMEGQMGIQYARPHRDGNDCPGHYSTMIMRSRLPANYHPPCLILPGLGAYSKMVDFQGLTFQALHDHLRTPPYPLPGTPHSSKAYRFALINYTPQRMAAAETRQQIGALPNIHTFLSPEMRAEKDLIKGLQGDSFANFLRDGPWIIPDESYPSYVGRVCYQMNRFLLIQAPSRFKLEIDPVMLAQSITYLTKDGERVPVEPWAMAPSVQGEAGNKRDAKREQGEQRSKEHMFKHSCMIPYYFTKSDWIREEAANRYGGSVASTSTGGGVDGDPEGGNNGDDEPGEDGEVHADQHGDAAKRIRSSYHQIGDDLNKDSYSGEPAEDIDPPLGSKIVVKPRIKARKVVAPKPEDAFKFTRSLTVDALEEEVLDLRQELQAMDDIDGDDKDTHEDIRATLNDANKSIELGGIGRRALAGIGTIIKDVHRLSRHIKREENQLRMTQMTLIRAQTAMRAKQDPKGRQQSWLSALTNQVVNMLVHREGRKVFKGSDYGMSWDCKEVVVENPYGGKRLLRGEDDTVEAARTIVMEIVEKWVDADDHCDKKQAWFATIVEEVMGEEALMMNIVWRLYSNLKASHVILGDKGYRNPTKDNMEPFQSALENHSVLEVDHQEGQLFKLYKQLLN
ncbi:hypothetical protein H1R20_g3595, partial [Candolleomyces eurysporus]